jgi:hypothetical protein
MDVAATIVSVQYIPGSPDAMVVEWNPGDGAAFSLQITDQTSGTATAYPVSGFQWELNPMIATGHAYVIAIATISGGVTGPYGPAIPILTAAPVVTRAQNNLTSLDLTWNVPTNYSGGYSATLQIPNVQSSTLPVNQPAASFQLQAPLTGDANTVSVQLQSVVSGATTNGPPTQYTVVTQVPTMVSVDNSSVSSLALTWTLPGAAGFKASLQSGGTTTSQQVATTTAVFHGPFSADSYVASVAATSADGVSIGPSSHHYTAITRKPTMTAVINTGAGLALTWQALEGCTGYIATKQQQGSSSSSMPVPGTSYTFKGPLSGSGYTCSVAGTGGNGVVIGPPSTTYDVIVGRPLWNMVAYDSGQMDLGWTAPADPGINGYLIAIDGLTPPTHPVGNVTTALLTVALTPLTSYPTTVRAVNGIVQGPPSPVLVPLSAAPTAPALGFTGSALQLAWTASGEGGVTAYTIELLANGASTESGTATASPARFTSAFAAGTRFTARIRSSGPGTLGPWCSPIGGPYKADITYGFDVQGRLQTVAWGDGFTESYTFDTAGNLLSVSYTTPPSPQPVGAH